MKKTFRYLIFIVLIYVLPLIFKLELLYSINILTLIAVTIILLTTQPEISEKEKKYINKSDKNSVYYILLCSGLGQVLNVIEWAYFNNSYSLGIINFIGLIIIIAGIFIRIKAFTYLGEYFSPIVTIENNHKLITSGPYRFIRHPTYTGAYLIMLGSALFLFTISGILVLGILMLFVYAYRIKIEEAVLIKHFDKEYFNYISKTKKMLPFIW